MSLFFICACAQKFNPYHSTASIPHYSETTKTSIRYISRGDSKSKSMEYGVFACVDSLNLKYLIFAPRSPHRVTNNPYSYYWMQRSVCLKIQDAKELLRVAKNSVDYWDLKKPVSDALYYEFKSAPEQEIKQISQNVVEWTPSIKYWYQLNISGSIAYLIFGENTLRHVVELERLENVQELIYLLEAGMKELDLMVDQ